MNLNDDDGGRVGRASSRSTPTGGSPHTLSPRRIASALAFGAVAVGLALGVARTGIGAGGAVDPPSVSTMVTTSPSTPTPVLKYAIVGAPTTAGFTVSTKTTNARSVRLKVGTDSGVTVGVGYGSPATPDGSGWAKPSIAGLSAGTRYYYAMEMTDSAARTTTTAPQGRPKTLPTGQASFTVAFGSCLRAGRGDRTAFDKLLARSPDLFFHLGDFHYANNTSTSQSSHLADVEKQLSANAGLRSVLKAVPTLAIKSDHDAGGGNDAMPGTYTAPNRAAYKQAFATPPLTDTNALYWSFTAGRVKFIFTDHRYPRASTSMMGSTQKAWFENELTTSEPVKVWVQDSTWTTHDAEKAGGDKWSDYPTERAELGDYIAASAVGQVITIHGDQHAISADDGTNNDWGGFPSFSAAPFRQTASHKGGPWSEGQYPTTTGSVVRQYGMLTVTDTGSNIAVTLTGYDSTNVARVRMTVNVPLVAPTEIETGEAVGAR